MPTMTEIKTTTWRDATRSALANRPVTLTYKKIALAIGVTEGWLKGFASGTTLNPGVNHVEALDNYLKQYNK